MQPKFSPSDLEGLALATGATLHRDDGTTFNSSKRSGVSVLPRQEKKAEPAPTPATTGYDALLQAIADMAAKLNIPAPMQPMQMPDINLPAPVVTVQAPQRVLNWTFDFVRNPDGTIKTIKARAE